MDEQPRRSWWGRNWIWVVPIGCLVVVLVGGGLATLIVTIVLWSFKSSPPYEQSLEIVRSHPQARTGLGDAIEPGFLVAGSIRVNGPSGQADFAYSVTGTQGEGTVYVVAHKKMGLWQITNLQLAVQDSGKRIDLLSPE
jgi:hypothetical protein